MNAAELKKYAENKGAKMIDCKFVDFLGTWQHITYPIERLEDGLENGFGFDGSSIRSPASRTAAIRAASPSAPSRT